MINRDPWAICLMNQSIIEELQQVTILPLSLDHHDDWWLRAIETYYHSVITRLQEGLIQEDRCQGRCQKVVSRLS